MGATDASLGIQSDGKRITWKRNILGGDKLQKSGKDHYQVTNADRIGKGSDDRGGNAATINLELSCACGRVVVGLCHFTVCRREFEFWIFPPVRN